MSKKMFVDFFWIAREQLERMEILIRKFLSLLDPDPDPLVRGMDPRIRIHTKMWWIRNTAAKNICFVTTIISVTNFTVSGTGGHFHIQAVPLSPGFSAAPFSAPFPAPDARPCKRMSDAINDYASVPE